MENNAENIRDEIMTEPPKKAFDWKKETSEWIISIVVAVVLAFVIRSFFFELVLVNGPSMENTMHTGDRLVVTKLGYTPKQGDIVVFTPDRHPDEPYIKRVIATEGQTVDINFNSGIVYVDGKKYEEDYIKNPTKNKSDVNFPLTVPKGCVFVMGDNRLESHDGRSLDVSSIKTENITSDDYQISYTDSETGKIINKPIYYGCVDNDDIIGKAQFRIWPFDKFGSLYK